MMVAVAEWQALWACENAASGVAAKVFWAKLEYGGIATAGLLWFLFAYAYTLPHRPFSRRALALPWIMPILTVGLALTNEHHHLIWNRIVPSSSVPTAPLVYYHGPWFWLTVIASYALMLGGSGLLLRSLVRFPHVYRGQAVTLVAGIAAPFIGNALYVLGWVPEPGLDLTPVALTLSGLLWFWSLFRFRLLDLVPVAREALIESMIDGVLVIDRCGCIVDSNPAARRLLGDGVLVGRDARALFTTSPEALALLRASGPAEIEVPAPGTADLYLEVRSIPLSTRGTKLPGLLVIVRDITVRRRDAAALRAQLAENLALQARLREEAIRDPLTGLFNRRYLGETLTRELARTAREGHPLALVLIDIDHFKALNDRFGHQMGDRALHEVGAALRKHTRAEDVACRYGGEEFAVVLVGASSAEAGAWAERWRRAVEQLRLCHDGAEITLTLSAGVASYTTGADSDAMLQAADRALYDAKRGGRNRVMLAPEDPLSRAAAAAEDPIPVTMAS